MFMKTLKSDEFNRWFKKQPNKIRVQILARLVRVEESNHFGTHKKLKTYLWELKFNNGNRIYYTIKTVNEEIMFIILGGNKNGQQKDIDKAEKIANQIHSE